MSPESLQSLAVAGSNPILADDIGWVFSSDVMMTVALKVRGQRRAMDLTLWTCCVFIRSYGPAVLRLAHALLARVIGVNDVRRSRRL